MSRETLHLKEQNNNVIPFDKKERDKQDEQKVRLTAYNITSAPKDKHDD